METLLIICLVLLLGSIGFSVFLWTLITKMNDKLNSISMLLNKSVMDNEDSKKFLAQVVESNGGEVCSAINKSVQDNKMLLDYQRSFMEKVSDRQNKDLDIIKERLDYLTTEVDIE